MSNDHTVLHNPVALLVLRVWMERGSALPLRAYIRQTANVSHGFEQSSTATDIEGAVDAVRTWLEGLLDADSAGNPPDVRGLMIEDPAGGSDGSGPDTANGSE